MSDNIIDPNLGLTKEEKLKHDDALMINAKINRHESKGETQERANRALRDIAAFIQMDTPEAPILKNAMYMGSAAVHVYQSPILNTMFFVSQADTMSSSVPEWTADKALIDLRKQMMVAYGKKITKKRSGF